MENELERQGDSTQVKRPEDLPQKLVEEIVVHLFCNKAFVLDKELAVKHTPISLFPAPVVRSLFSKCSFYNICMSKILDLTVRNKSLMDRLVAKYVDYDLKLKRLNIVREVENRQKTHFVLYRNEYKIDKREKFVFLDNSSTCVFKDINAFKSCSDFFDVFSSKYPQYFPSYADQIVKQTSSIIDILADSVVDLMKELHGGEEYKERIIIILDDKGEAILDQFRLIDRLYNQHEVTALRLSVSEAGQLGSLDEENNLIINSKKVFMCLFINDISAEDLLNDSYWKTRCLLEGSNALKCPDVGSQIACLPSFQYELQRKDYVKSIIKDEELSDEMLRFFPRTYYMKDFSLNRDSLIALRQEKSNKELEVKKSEELKDLKETLFKKEQNKEENEQNQEIKIEDFQIPSESLEELEAKYNALKQDALAAIESEVNEILDRTANDKTKAISDISKETFKAYSIDHGKTLDDAFVDVTACEGFFKRKIEEPVFSNLALIDKGIVKGDFVNSINVFSLVVSNENRVITNRNLCVGSKSTCLKDGRSVYDTACLVDLKDETEISYDTY